MAAKAAGLILALALAATAALAQPANDRLLKTPQTPWSALAPEERRILGPVEPDWNHMPGYQQQRLIASARRYPSFQPIQKERFDARIRDWAAMTPDQRREAREAFQGLRRLPPAKQHELRERWLQRHRPAEESSEPSFAPAPPNYAPAQTERSAPPRAVPPRYERTVPPPPTRERPARPQRESPNPPR